MTPAETMRRDTLAARMRQGRRMSLAMIVELAALNQREAAENGRAITPDNEPAPERGKGPSPEFMRRRERRRANDLDVTPPKRRRLSVTGD